jgi:hypothetical protein
MNLEDAYGSDADPNVNVATLKDLPFPPCTPEDVKGAPSAYLEKFLPPRVSKDGNGILCVGCGSTLFLAGMIGFLLGSTF